MPALMTEMHQDGSLDLDATARHIEACIDAGVSGIVVLGTLGENPSLGVDEKVQVVTCAVEASNGRRIHARVRRKHYSPGEGCRL